jgi:apolipoprotein N-acyltransferase
LRFAWITPGGACDAESWLALPKDWGLYGAGFLFAIAAALLASRLDHGGLRPTRRGFTVAVIASLGLWLQSSFKDTRPGVIPIEVAGAQLEMAGAPEVMEALKQMAARHPSARLLVLSEYTFDGPVPETVLAWCRRNDRYLIVGGKEPLPDKKFRNTVFVVGPEGKIVFSQVKAVPIQFFDDGLPAEEQKVWHSPWGAIGICVCYDLSFSRVVDRLARLGAQAVISPAMDAEHWGAYQHELHRRITRIRAAEYRLPIMRLASSGISQIVNRDGVEQATAPFPGQGEIIHGFLQLEQPATPHLPPDRILAPVCVGVTGLAALILLMQSWRDRRRIA